LRTVSILGCGWLGKPFAATLVKEGYIVYGSTTQEARVSELAAFGIKPFVITFNPTATGDNLDVFFQCDILVISIPPRTRTAPPEAYLSQLEQAVQCAKRGRVEHILYISSTAVYPDVNRIVTEEDADHQSHLAKAEAIVQSFGSTTVVRFGGLVGPARHPGRFLSGKKDLAGKNTPVNIIHQHDCIGIMKCIIGQQVWDEVFNACADEHPSRETFYTQASLALSLEPPQFLPNDSNPYKIVSSKKVKQRLGYTFVYPDPIAMIGKEKMEER
jgi:nucleoside-diphosphate-sugar epimerase